MGLAGLKSVTPISGPGQDNPIPATALSGGCNDQLSFNGNPVPNNCALYNYPSITYTPKSIADQLVAIGKSWKTYQESLPTVPLTGGSPPPLPSLLSASTTRTACGRA